MKNKLIIIIFLLGIAWILPCAARAGKQAWTFKIGQVAAGTTVYGATGVTTTTGNEYAGISDSSVSPFFRRTGPLPKELRSDLYVIDISDSGGRLVVRLKDGSTSQISSDADLTPLTGLTDFSSETSCWVLGKVAWENTVDAWSKAEFFPVLKDVALNSGTSRRAVAVELPIGNYFRAYFLPSGNTPFGLAEIEVAAGIEGQGWQIPLPYALDHYGSDFSTAGVTKMSTAHVLSDGTRCVECQWNGDGAYYSSPFDSGVSKYVADGDIIQMPANEYNDAQWWPEGNSTGTWNVQEWTACPPRE